MSGEYRLLQNFLQYNDYLIKVGAHSHNYKSCYTHKVKELKYNTSASRNV